jgi:nucleoside transporter
MHFRSLPIHIGSRLSVMMFLQFFVWGAWYVTAPTYLTSLGFTGDDFKWTYSVGPIAGMISPFFLGFIADRFFATERVLGVLHLLGAAAMYGAVRVMQGESPTPNTINWLFFAHMLCYFPTLALANTLSLHNLTDTERQFPWIRVWGTIGWIAAGWVLGTRATNWGGSIEQFWLVIGAQVALGVFSFALPHTPPPARGKAFSAAAAIGADAFVLLKRPSFAIFMVSSFLICIPLAFYYQLAARGIQAGGIQDVPTTMTFGQISEIFFMVIMPFFFVRLGVKGMLLVGMAAWVGRYFLFATGVPDQVAWMLYTGVILHGICYDFFFVTGQLYTDRVAPIEVRGQAQGMLVLFTLGLGMLIGAQIAGKVETTYTPSEDPEFTALQSGTKTAGDELARLKVEFEKLPEGAERTALLEKVKAGEEKQNTLTTGLLKLMDWKSIWTIPAYMALGVLVLFALLFRDDSTKRPGGVQLEEGHP